eukprot:3875492-Amphidinium_carterae.2
MASWFLFGGRKPQNPLRTISVAVANLWLNSWAASAVTQYVPELGPEIAVPPFLADASAVTGLLAPPLV